MRFDWVDGSFTFLDSALTLWIDLVIETDPIEVNGENSGLVYGVQPILGNNCTLNYASLLPVDARTSQLNFKDTDLRRAEERDQGGRVFENNNKGNLPPTGEPARSKPEKASESSIAI